MNTQTAIQTTCAPSAPEHDRNPQRRIQPAIVRQLCGDISDMTLWRWMDNSELNFPRPIYIGRRRFWREAEIFAWLESREVAA